MKKQVLLLVMALLPMVASAYDVVSGDIYYNYINNGKELSVTYRYSYSGTIDIPKTVVFKGVTYRVTSIGDGAFSGCSVTSVIIPNSVTTIGNHAFNYCERLKSIDIPNSVTSIGDGAFSGCSGLTSVNIPNSVTSIGDYAFYKCI